MASVQRFVVRVKPSAAHEEFYEWQVGTVCVFVGDHDRSRAQDTAEALIAQHHFEIIEYSEKATLIEDRVREQGGEVYDAFLRAREVEPFFRWAPDRIPFARKDGGIPLMVPPQVGETFVDQVVRRAGGRRLTAEETEHGHAKSVDYVLNGYLVELKNLQADLLEVRTRQEKVGDAIGQFVFPGDTVLLDPQQMGDAEGERFRRILAKPVKRRLDDAKKQIRASKQRLGSWVRGGGVLLLNTGVGVIAPDDLFAIASDLAATSRTIDFVACMSVIVATDGFDTTVTFPFHPESGGTSAVEALRRAYPEEAERLMTDFMRSEEPPENPAVPQSPLSFEVGDVRFYRPGPTVPSSFSKDDDGDDG